MNALLIGIVAWLVIMTVNGHKKGFIRKLVGIVSWIITLILVSMALPSIVEFLQQNTSLQEAVEAGIASSDVELMQMLKIVGLEEMAGEFVADKVLRLVAFVVTLAMVGVVVHGAAGALHIASRLPLLKGTNQLLGAVVGFLEGVLWIWVLFLVIGAGSTSSWGSAALRMIADSDLLTWFFANNPLLLLLKT